MIRQIKNIHRMKLSQQSTIKYSFNDVDRLIGTACVMLSKEIMDTEPRMTFIVDIYVL
jgi:hypothetical protein